jgi:hypothetical protein
VNNIPTLHWKTSAINQEQSLAMADDGFYGVAPIGGEWALTWFPAGHGAESLGSFARKIDAMLAASDHLGD